MKKLPSKQQSKKPNPPFIFTLIKKCNDYKISYDLMCRLNYNDLMYLVIEYDIEAVQSTLQNIENMRMEKQGYKVIDATNDMILKMHRKGGVQSG